MDRACAAWFAEQGVSRSMIAAACEQASVWVNGRPVKARHLLRAGDGVVVELPPPPPSDALPEDLPLHVVHEDAWLLVVDKAAGTVVHPARGHTTGTLVNALLHHDAELAGAEAEDDDPRRPGIVHRIDKDTSGLLVVARTTAAREHLKAQFAAHTIERVYEAITVGIPPQKVTYDTLHGRHPTDRLRFSGKVKQGRRAVTHVTLVTAFGTRAAHVRCTLETGRTHQIRMHLAEAGHPLLADALYGKPPRDPDLRAIAAALGRQALHAAVLGFVHPETGARMRFASPLPEDMATALRTLAGAT